MATAALSVDGVYLTYLTGTFGSSFGLFLFKDGIISGADAGGGKYDGKYAVYADGTKILGQIKFILRHGNTSITGVTAEASSIPVDVPVAFDLPIDPNTVVRIETPIGPINARLEKLRDI